MDKPEVETPCSTSLSEAEKPALLQKIFSLSEVIIDSISSVDHDTLFEPIEALSISLHFSTSCALPITEFKTALIKGLQNEFSTTKSLKILAEQMQNLHIKIRDLVSAKCLLLVIKKSDARFSLPPLKENQYQLLVKHLTSGVFRQGSQLDSRLDVAAFQEEVSTGFARYSKPSKDPYQTTLVRKLIELLKLLEESKLCKKI